MINKIEYSWEDITISAMGRTLERILDIEYDTEVEKKALYGRGKKVRGIGGGNEKPGGSFTIGQSEFESLVRTAQQTDPNAKITDLTFDIQVHYLSGTDLVKDRIIGATLKNQPKGMKQGDTDMNIKLQFLCTDILYNIS